MGNILIRIEQIAKNENLTITAFERAIGASKGVLSRAIAHNTDIQAKWIRSVVDNFPAYSEEWLLTGNGSMLKPQNTLYPDRSGGKNFVRDHHATYNLNSEVFSAEPSTDQPIPIYELGKNISLSKIFSDESGKLRIGTLCLPDSPFCDGALKIRGDSMSPLLQNGDIIIFKKLKKITNIIWGQMYLLSFDLDGEEYVSINYIHKSEKQGSVKLVSYNPNYAPKDIDILDIKALALIKVSIRYNTMM